MLKRLKLQAEMKQRNAELQQLLDMKAGFEKRQSELSSDLEEAKTDEEINLVKDSIADLEKEVTDSDISTKETNVRAEITKIESELKALDEKAPAPATPATPATPVATNNNTRGGNISMKKRGLFYTLSAEIRSELLQNEEVTGFLTRCRELKGQTRAVKNGDINVPEVMLEIIRDNLNSYSKLISKVSLKPVGGKARQTITGSIPEAIWTEAIANFNEMDIAFNQIEVDAFKVGGYIPIANSTLEDNDALLIAEIFESIAQGIGLGVDKAICYGTGNKMPLGIVTRLAQTSQPSTWENNAPDWTDLHTTHILKWASSSMTGEEFFAKLITELSVCKANYSNGEMFWVMNTKTKAKIMAKALKFNAAAALTSSVSKEMPIVSGEIITLDFMADNDILGGYGSLYLLAERAGATFASSDAPKFIQDQTVFKGCARYDGKPIFGEAFVLVNIENTNPTTTVTFAGDSANVERVSLKSLTIGATPVTLYPPFDKNVLNYACTVTAHANKITAESMESGATVAIKNGDTAVTNGSNATFTAGENTLTFEVTNGNATKRTYTVIVKDETT